MSSSTSGAGRNVTVAPVVDGVADTSAAADLGEAGPTAITYHTYTIPSDGDYVVYSSDQGINIFYISLFGVRTGTEPKPTYTLTTTVNGTGTIELSPAGESYEKDTVVTLTAKPGAGQRFSKWSGDLSGTTNPTTINMDKDKSVTAEFVPEDTETFTLNVSVNIEGAGSVSLNPDGGTYNSGDIVELTATPVNGYKFSKWSGDITVTTNPTTIPMNGNKTVVAEFEEAEKVPMPFSENFDAATTESFTTSDYKALPDDPTLPMYKKTGGTLTIESGALTVVSGRFTIGDKGTATTGTTQPNGTFDLSKPYKVSFKVTVIGGTDITKTLQVYVDNNTTSGSNSIHGSSSQILKRAGNTLAVDEVIELTPSVGTKTSFIQIRTETGLTVTIDDLVIEYL